MTRGLTSDVSTRDGIVIGGSREVPPAAGRLPRAVTPRLYPSARNGVDSRKRGEPMRSTIAIAAFAGCLMLSVGLSAQDPPEATGAAADPDAPLDVGATASTEVRMVLTDVVVVGLATDYCVKETALDAARMGFSAAVLADGIRSVNLSPGDGARAIADLVGAGVVVR